MKEVSDGKFSSFVGTENRRLWGGCLRAGAAGTVKRTKKKKSKS